MAAEIIFYLTLFLGTVTTIISIYNLLTAPRITQLKHKLKDKPLISILIPARNEEKNIGFCISDICKQTYQNYELIVLDDESEDKTAIIAENEISGFRASNRIELISGKPIPPGWVGKNWACHQLSVEAKGQYLLFIDADVRLKPYVIESALYSIHKYKLKLITCFSTQIIASFGEWLIVPLMNFLLLTFLPLKKVYSSEKKSFIAANGQFLLIQRSVYDEIGGHRAVASKVVEDMEIAREVKKRGLRMMTFLGENSISCRMYSGFKEAFVGFTKNFFPGFNTSPLIFILFLFLLLLTFFLPFLLLVMNSKFGWVVIIILLGRLTTSLSSKQSFLINCFIHPVQILIMISIGINSVYRTTKKKLRWKERYI